MQKAISALLFALCAALSVAAHADAAFQPFEPGSLDRIVEKQNGKPFILLVWSLECEYCQASLKTLSQEKRKRKDLHVITLSTDSLDDPQTVALMQQKLAAHGMTRNAWAFGPAPAEQLRYALDPKWRGELPRSYWFNARGERTAYSGALTPAIIDRLWPQ